MHLHQLQKIRLEKIFEQMFSDDVLVYGDALTNSYVTVLVGGSKEDVLSDRSGPSNLQHKHCKHLGWMCHGSIFEGRKGIVTFWERD